MTTATSRPVVASTPAAAVLDHVGDGTDIIVPLANGEPVTLLDAVEGEGQGLSGVRVHQMHALHDRPYLHGAFGDRLRHVSYFLSHVTRPCFQAGTIDLVPNNFSEMRAILHDATTDPLVLAAASPPDRHGYFSLGLNADYIASFIGRARFFLEANAQMPRTFGRNQVHVSQVVGWTEADYPLVEVPPPAIDGDADLRIAALVAERIADGATIQTGIGAIPNAILSTLVDHRDLGVHTELISDGVIDLVERGVVTGVTQAAQPHEDGRHVRPRHAAALRLPAREHGVRALAGALRQRPPRHRPGDGTSCRSTRRSRSTCSASARRRPWPARTTRRAAARPTSPAGRCTPTGGQGFVVLHSTAKDGDDLEDRPAARRRRCRDDTQEHGRQGRHRVGRRRAARPVDPRAAPLTLIAIAHPDHRDRLRSAAHQLGYI